MQHAKLSASGSAQWLNCPGSVKAQENYGDDTNEFAMEGTRAHEVADRCLKKGKDAAKYVGKTVHNVVIDSTMAEYVQEYLDYVRSHEGENTKLFTEERVDFSNVVPEGFGTLDAAVLDYDTGICHIFDLKYGRGVQVYSYENTQSQLYALGMINELGWMDAIKSFRIHIVQPRKVTPPPWDVSVADLQQFATFATERAELAMTNSAPRVPGDKQCQWCKAKGDCAALGKFVEESISAEFDDLDNICAEDLDDYRKKTILDNKKLIINFVEAVEKSVYNQIEDGTGFDGYKLVSGRSARVWTDDAEAYLVTTLGDDAYNKKLIGVGAAEKLVEDKKDLDAYLTKPEGKPTLAPEHDKRDAINNDVTEDFENLG